MRVGALAPLLWRPFTVPLLLPLFWAIAIPLFLLAERGAPVGSLWALEAHPEARLAAWHLVVLVPAAVGLMLASARLELQHATLSWMLPDARRRLLAESLGVAVPLSLALGLMAGHGAAALVLAGMGVALFWFAAASAAADGAFPRSLRWLVALAFVPIAFRPESVAGLAERAPWAVALMTLASSAWLLRYPFSRSAARLRPFGWSPVGAGSAREYWAGRREWVGSWSGSLATDRVGPWLRAAGHEARVPLAFWFAAMAALAAGTAYLMDDPGMIPVLAGLAFCFGRLQLASSLLYPLSRRRRGEVAMAGAAAEAAIVTLLAAALVLAAQATEIPAWTRAVDAAPRAGWPVALALMWAWAPVALWPGVRWPPTESLRFGRRLPWYFAYVVVATLSADMAPAHDPALLAATTAGIGAVTHMGLWLAIRRHFARGDLAVR
jgi:hypothetical protein